jgi:hypothetical protein
VEARPLPHGSLLVDLTTGRCFKLNGVGTQIWNILATPTSLDEICQQVAARYNIAPDRVGEDTRALIRQLLDENVIEASAPSRSSAK